MKNVFLIIFIIIFLTASAGLVSAGKLETNVNADTTKMNKNIKSDRELIVNTIFGLFIKEHSMPADKVKIYFIAGEDTEHLDMKDFPASDFVLKRGNGYEFRNGICYDKETGLPCKIVTVWVLSVEGNTAKAAISWGKSSLGAGGTSYQLKKINGVWEIEKILSRFAV